jgi:hypothetical protein
VFSEIGALGRICDITTWENCITLGFLELLACTSFGGSGQVVRVHATFRTASRRCKWLARDEYDERPAVQSTRSVVVGMSFGWKARMLADELHQILAPIADDE